MPDRDVYERALAEITAAERRVAELRVFVRLYEELRDTGAVAATGQPVIPPDDNAVQPSPDVAFAPPLAAPPSRHGRVPPVSRARPIPGDLFKSTAIKMFKEVGRPLLRAEMLEELAKRGMPIGGKNPLDNLGTKLWRSADVIQVVPGHGYWPVGWPLPVMETVTADNGGDDSGESAAPVRHAAGNGAALFN